MAIKKVFRRPQAGRGRLVGHVTHMGADWSLTDDFGLNAWLYSAGMEITVSEQASNEALG